MFFAIKIMRISLASQKMGMIREDTKMKIHMAVILKIDNFFYRVRIISKNLCIFAKIYSKFLLKFLSERVHYFKKAVFVNVQIL